MSTTCYYCTQYLKCLCRSYDSSINDTRSSTQTEGVSQKVSPQISDQSPVLWVRAHRIIITACKLSPSHTNHKHLGVLCSLGGSNTYNGIHRYTLRYLYVHYTQGTPTPTTCGKRKVYHMFSNLTVGSLATKKVECCQAGLQHVR